jgi:hypothetical protein
MITSEDSILEELKKMIVFLKMRGYTEDDD